MYENIVSTLKMYLNKNSKFFGMEIKKQDKGSSLSQIECIESLLVKHKLENFKSVKTPIVKGENKSLPLKNE